MSRVNISFNSGEGSYDNATINSPNPFVRFAHRNRIRQCIKYISPRLKIIDTDVHFGGVLDYGCGTGALVSMLNTHSPGSTIGYEPFKQERFSEHLPVYCEYNDIKRRSPFHTITLFEVIEHLNDAGLDEFLVRCNELLSLHGVIIFSAPVEIGPALFFKAMYRLQLTQKTEYNIVELFKAGIFGFAPSRTDFEEMHGYVTHKGFDFRKAINYLKSKNYLIKILGYSPFPMLGWYGNSQIFFMAEKQS
jgi:hypothetical protein